MSQNVKMSFYMFTKCIRFFKCFTVLFNINYITLNVAQFEYSFKLNFAKKDAFPFNQKYLMAFFFCWKCVTEIEEISLGFFEYYCLKTGKIFGTILHLKKSSFVRSQITENRSTANMLNCCAFFAQCIHILCEFTVQRHLTMNTKLNSFSRSLQYSIHISVRRLCTNDKRPLRSAISQCDVW